MGDYRNCSVLYCVLTLYTVRSTLRWAVLKLYGLGFVSLGQYHCM